jgi:hypothetical protein
MRQADRFREALNSRDIGLVRHRFLLKRARYQRNADRERAAARARWVPRSKRREEAGHA